MRLPRYTNVKYAPIAASSNGNNTLVAAVTGKRIRVLAFSLDASGTANAKFQDGAGGTDLTGLFYGTVGLKQTWPYNPHGWFQTTAGTLLNLNLSAGFAVGGCLVYEEV